jgi:hypothetical protein
MKNTTHYNLKKPESADYYNIDDQNTNMDIIDAEICKKVDKIDGKGLSTEDYTTVEKNKLAQIYDWATGLFSLKSHHHDTVYEKTITKKSGFNLEKSDSVSSASSSILATLKGVKTAYDKAVSAYNLASSKLGVTAKATDSDKLDGVQGINKLNVTAHTKREINKNPNNFREPGIYRLYSMLSNLPNGYSAGNNDFILLVTRIHDTNQFWVQQKLLDVRSNREFTRRELGGVWETSWSEVFHQNNYGKVITISSSVTLNSTHVNKVLRFTNSSDIVVTVPKNLTDNGKIALVRAGAGKVTTVTASGMTLNSIDSKRSIKDRFALNVLMFNSLTNADLFGSLE